MKAFVVAVSCMVLAQTASAQVGSLPERSPYRDLEYTQELTVLGGYVRAKTDPAGVAPQSAATVGLRYEWSVAGPLAVTSEITNTFSHRNVLEPTRPAATRALGTESATVYSVDAGLALNLTGRKSWHSLVPQVRGGIGFVSSRAKDDSSGFAVGTPLAFSLGGGLKFVPGGRYQLRADVTDRIFHIGYPDAYFRTASDNTAVLDQQTARRFYTNHLALTVGVSYLFSR